MEKPLSSPESDVSVVICNYNYEKFVSTAIESVLQQSVPAKQLIIIDDGSTDASREIIDRYQGDTITKIFKENGGQCSAYNVGLEVVTGKYVVFLDSDDRILPNAIECIQKLFKNGVSKVQYPLMLVDKNGNRLGAQIPRACDSGDVKKLILDGFEYNSPPASGNAYLVSGLRRVFPIPLHPNERYAADFFAIFSVPFFGSVVTAPEPLGEYRVHLQESHTVGFGNGGSFIGLQQRNVDILGEWLFPVLGIRIPSQLLNFSILKLRYARAVLSPDKWATRINNCIGLLPAIFKSIWYREGLGFMTQLVLTLWVLLLPLIPRRVALNMAILVCRPDSRARVFDLIRNPTRLIRPT